MTRLRGWRRTVALLALSLALALVIAIGERLLFAAALQRPLDVDEFDAVGLTALLTAIPFLYLAFRPRKSLWVVAVTATVLAHGWWLAEGIAYHLRGEGGGVPIVGAVLMLLAPFAILLVIGLLDLGMARRAKGG